MDNCGLRYDWGSGRTLPTVYQNVLSYEEQIRMLICDIDKAHEEIKYMREQIDSMVEYTKKVVIESALDFLDVEFLKMKNEMLDMYQQMLNLVSGANEAYLMRQTQLFDDWKRQNFLALQSVQRRVITVKRSVDELSTVWQEGLKDINDKADEWLEESKNALIEQIHSLMGRDITVLNPVNKLYENLDKVLSDLYQLQMNVGGITVESFEKLRFTVDEWAERKITVNEFLYNAQYALRDVLVEKPFYSYVDKNVGDLRQEMIEDYNRLEGSLYVTNAFTGKQEWVGNAIAFLFNLHQQKGISVQDFEKINETVDEFNDRKLQVYTFAVQGIA